MTRSGQVTLTAAANGDNLLKLILAIANIVPTEGYFPNRVRVLDLQVDSSTPGTVNILDKNTNGQGEYFSSTFHRESIRNSIYLGDWVLKGSGLKVDFNVEAD